MKNRLFHIILILIASFGCFRPLQASAGELFPYPTPPDTMIALQPRCDYIVSRFWDRCNFGTAFRNHDKLNNTFGDWIAIMPHASADTVHASIDKLLGRFAKKGDETLQLATMAENLLYSDTASIFSEEMYLPFARAAANHKKISNADKARFRLHTKIIESSGLGAYIPDIEYIRPDGSHGRLSETIGKSILIFINDPDCSDCNMARVRLSADYNANELIRRGELVIVSLYPDEVTDEWKETASSYPDNWINGAVEDADTYFDLRAMPVFLFLNSRHKVLAKNMDLDYLLTAFRIANTQSNRQ